MNIRIGFSTSRNSWISKVIRWFTDSGVSHCFFIYFDEDWERDMVLEATSGGFRIVPYSFYAESTLVSLTPAYPVDVGIKKSLDWLGVGYDYGGLLGMAWVEIGRRLKCAWRNPWRGANTMFCSEAIVRILQESGYPGADTLDAQSTDPQMLLDFLSNSGAKEESF
jgi:hypothetical protein